MLIPVEEAKILASSILDAELIVIENAGHAPPKTQPLRVVKAMEKSLAV
jgi:pimeloyl-ACP methyl ester carboxylesterase